jgi:hypothetical protein
MMRFLENGGGAFAANLEWFCVEWWTEKMVPPLAWPMHLVHFSKNGGGRHLFVWVGTKIVLVRNIGSPKK